MTPTSPTPIPVSGAERLLSSLAGILSARVVADRQGRIEEIHVLADPSLHPKQVVRNVESALRAGLGIEVDRRVVSVAQVRSGDRLPEGLAPATAGGSTAAAQPRTGSAPQVPGQQRFVFVGFDVRSSASHEAVCQVTLRRGPTTFSGKGEGIATPLGRTTAAARAVLTALTDARGLNDLALEGTALVEVHGRTYVLVAAHGLAGRSSVTLAGVAPLFRSPEEAAILAALQATNRWVERS